MKNMNYTVSAAMGNGLTLNEKDPIKSILQNISILLRTWRGEVPLFRDFGLQMSFLDKPVNVAAPVIIAEIREAMMKYEPRAELVSVKFDHSSSGVLYPVVEVRIDARYRV